MLLSLKELTGFAVQAKDGESGQISDFYFDEIEWNVRYIIDKTRSGLRSRQLMISPESVEAILLDDKKLLTALACAELEKSPMAKEEKPLAKDVGKKDEKAADFITGLDSVTGNPNVMVKSFGPVTFPPKRTIIRDSQSDGANLHSSKDVLGYQISTNRGELGAVEDFIVDDETWDIRYLVIEVKSILGDKKILIAPEWIDWISWKQKKVSVSMDQEKIMACPNFNLATPIMREYEELLYDHYECKRYWDKQ